MLAPRQPWTVNPAYRYGRALTPWAPGGGMENIVRSFVEIDSQPINRIFRRPDPTPSAPEALICWGESSQFVFPPQTVAPPSDPAGGGGITVNWPEDDGELQDIPPLRMLTEVSRVTSDKRIENPQDPEQYVIVQRIDELVMVDSIDGESITFIFDNPP